MYIRVRFTRIEEYYTNMHFILSGCCKTAPKKAKGIIIEIKQAAFIDKIGVRLHHFLTETAECLKLSGE